MRRVNGVDVLRGPASIVVAPRYLLAGDGLFAKSANTVLVSDRDITLDVVVAVRAALRDSRDTDPIDGKRAAVTADAERAWMAAIGVDDWPRFVDVVEWVFVGTDATGHYAVEDSDAFGGESPGFRFHTAYQALTRPSDAELRDALEVGFARCTRSAAP